MIDPLDNLPPFGDDFAGPPEETDDDDTDEIVARANLAVERHYRDTSRQCVCGNAIGPALRGGVCALCWGAA